MYRSNALPHNVEFKCINAPVYNLTILSLSFVAALLYDLKLLFFCCNTFVCIVLLTQYNNVKINKSSVAFKVLSANVKA